MKTSKFTGLARAIDPNYFTNKIILILSVLGSLIYLMIKSEPFLNSLYFGVSIFLCWAMNREIDPDRNLSAFLALIPLTLVVFSSPFISLLSVMFWLLLNLRILNRTTGLKIMLSDYLAVLAIGFFLSLKYNAPLFITATFALLLFAALYKKEKTARPALGLSFLAVIFFLSGNFSLPKFLWGPYTYFFLLLSVIFLIIIDRDPAPESLNDLGEKKISPIDLKAAQSFYLIFALFFHFSGFSFWETLIIWSPAIGTIAERLLHKISSIVR